MAGRPLGSTQRCFQTVEEHPPPCPNCGSTAHRVLRVLRQDPAPTASFPRAHLIRRRVTCLDCGQPYILLTHEQRL
jgi:ribosomal protein S27AE